MSERHGFCCVVILLAVCATGHADPFGSVPPTPDKAEAEAPVAAPDYRVVGAAMLGERAIAIVRMADGRFHLVKPGERIGGATVTRITLDAVHLETAHGGVRLPVAD